MKLYHRVLAGVLALLCVVSGFVFSPVKTTAETSSTNDQVSYKKKVVSVVYDTSYSMTGSMVGSKNQYRAENARYALQMLIALLGEQDELFVVPMNYATDSDRTDKYISVDLTNPDRNSVVEDVEAEVASAAQDGGATPGGAAIDVAKQLLVDRGLPQKGNTDVSSGGLCEYWLLVLTDGGFTGGPNGMDSKKYTKEVLLDLSDTYPTLQTIYLSFGISVGDPTNDPIDLSKDPDFATYSSFTAIYVSQPTELPGAMQAVANKISGRYLLEDNAYTVSGNKITVDLGSTSLYLRTISLVLQNCGAKLVSASYQGAEGKMSPAITQASTIVPDPNLKLQNGYSAVLSGDPYFNAGTLTLEFDKPVTKNNISILLEPALTMEVVVEYQDYVGLHKIESSEDYKKLAPAQKVRIDYVIKELGSNRIVDRAEVGADATITYSGDGKTYEAMDEIVLVLGDHVIGVLVTMLEGAYSMYVPIPVKIEQNDELFFRVEGKVTQDVDNPAHGKAEYTVIYDNFPVGKDALAPYSIRVDLVDPNGNSTQLNHTIQADGTIVAEFNLPEGLYGEYQVIATVQHPDTTKDPRVKALDAMYPPLNITLAPKDNQQMSLSHYKLAHNEDAMTFELLADGKPFNFDGRFITYSVKLGSRDVTQYVTINGNILSFVPTRDSLGSFASEIGTQELVVSMQFKAFPEIAASASGTVTLIETVYSLTIDGTDSMRFSHHQLSQNTEPFRFVLDAGGYPMSFDDPLVSYQVKLGTKDITSYCTVEGNVLSYVPSVESFGEYADDEDLKEIVVTVTSSVLPLLNLSKTVRVNLGQTLYEILVVEKGERDFDRFSLKVSGAYIDFVVLRDGTPMPYAELEQAIADKEFGLESKLFKNVLLPTGYSLSASEILGDGVIRVTVERDQIGILAAFTGMLITDGDKPLTISFRGVSQNDAFVAKASPLFEYIWRLMIIAAIIYLIIFALLTPSRRRHWRGALVTMTVTPSMAKGRPNLKTAPVGMRLRDRLIFRRLIPIFGLLENQQPKKFQYFTLQLDRTVSGKKGKGKKKKAKAEPGKEYIYFTSHSISILRYKHDQINEDACAEDLQSLRRLIASMPYATLSGSRIRLDNFASITNGSMTQSFPYELHTEVSGQGTNECEPGTVEKLSADTYYACYRTEAGKKKLVAIVFFVKASKTSGKKKRRR